MKTIPQSSALAVTLQRSIEHTIRERLLAEYHPGTSSTFRLGRRAITVTRHSACRWEVGSVDQDWYGIDEAIRRILDA